MTQRLPAFFISHGGGPWPWMPEMKGMYQKTVDALSELGRTYKPDAILMVSAHWEEQDFTIGTAPHPGMIYDYGGFPPHTYTIKYSAPGEPLIADKIRKSLIESGIKIEVNPSRGFDHGTFVPLYCIYPEANVPIVQLSIKTNYSPLDHFKLGESLTKFRDQNILIIGSGLTYHNLRKFFNGSGVDASIAFEKWLTTSIESDPLQRKEALLNWDKAPFAREAHPQEDHLVPLFVIAGASGDGQGKRLFLDNVYGVEMASYEFN